jgi:putative ABC transport system ATP-binding protein
MSISPNLKSNIKLRSGVSGISITGKNISKTFGEGDMKTTAVNDVSIEIKQGEVALMMGPSGSGKTTLLAILSGLLKPDNGKVVALGQEIWALNERERENFRLKHCSFIFQGYNLFASLTARQQLEIVAQWGDGISSREARKKADEILDVLGLLKKAHLRPGELSGGEKQRVAIGRALIKNPDFCFADEPTSALDWAHGEQVIDILRSTAHDRGCTVLIVAHDARVIPYADKIFYLEDGKMIDDGGKSIHKTYGKAP